MVRATKLSTALIVVGAAALLPLAAQGDNAGVTLDSVATSRPSFGCDVLVQGAMDVEVQPILDVLQDAQQVQIAAWTFWTGTIGNQRVVVSRTEVGPTNAAAATVLGIEHFRPRLIINQGCGGGHIKELKIGDIVLGASCVEYGAFNSSHGEAGTGVQLERWRPRYNRLRLDGQRKTTIRQIPGDAEALKVAQSTAYAAGKLVKGRIGSAHQWNRELDLIAWNHRKFGTVSEDMESAFAAMVAKAFGTRFVAIRIISDNELRGPEVKIEETTAACAKYVIDVIRNLETATLHTGAGKQDTLTKE